MALETSFTQSPCGDQSTSRYGKIGNQKRASCFATMMQNGLIYDVARFTTPTNQTCLAKNQVQTPPLPPPAPLRKKIGKSDVCVSPVLTVFR